MTIDTLNWKLGSYIGPAENEVHCCLCFFTGSELKKANPAGRRMAQRQTFLRKDKVAGCGGEPETCLHRRTFTNTSFAHSSVYVCAVQWSNPRSVPHSSLCPALIHLLTRYYRDTAEKNAESRLIDRDAREPGLKEDSQHWEAVT